MKKISSRRIPGLLVCAVLTMTLAMLTAGCGGPSASAESAAAGSDTPATVHDTVYDEQETAASVAVAEPEETVQTVGDTVYRDPYANVEEQPQTVADTVYGDETVEIPELGTGEICVAFLWEDNAGNSGQYYIHTNAETVGEALEEVGLITGQDGKVLSVDGHEADGGSWRFCIDGQNADTGIYETPVLEGREYGLYAE